MSADATEYSELHESVSHNHEEMTKNLVNRNYDVNSRDCTGMTPLMIAIRNKNELIMEILLNAGADVTMLNYTNNSALQMFCARHFYTSMIQKLFFHNLRQKFSTSEETAECLIDAGCHLYQAAYLGDAEIEYMLKKGFSANSMHPASKKTALHVAVSMENVDSVKLLLKYAGSVSDNVFGHVSSSVEKNIDNEKVEQILASHLLASYTAEYSNLYQSCAYDDEKMTQSLLNKYYYVNAQEYDGITHLMKALKNKQQTIMQILLAAGADVRMSNHRNKQSSLHLAVSLDNLDAVKLLLKYGADIDAQDIRGSTPLSYLYQSRTEHTWEKVEILKKFLNSESSPTSSDFAGAFQIGPVLRRGSREMIRVILQSNIDFTAKDQRSEINVLHYLAVNVNPGVVDEIKLHLDQFDVNVVNALGLSPLHVAVKFSNVPMVELLLSQGVSSNCAHNQYGYTPLYYAYAKFSKKKKKM